MEAEGRTGKWKVKVRSILNSMLWCVLLTLEWSARGSFNCKFIGGVLEETKIEYKQA